VPVPVPPSWFRTTSTVCSACELRVCCTPQPAEGSPRFVRADRGSPEGGSMPGSVPAVQFAPSEEFPSSAAGNASLRPLPSCRYRPARHWAPAEAGVRCRPRSPLVRGAYDRRASLGRGDRAPKGEGPIPADGAAWLRRAGWAGSGDRWAGLRRAPSPGSREVGSRFRRAAGLPRWSGGFLPCREGTHRLRRAGGPNPGERGRAALRRAPSPGSGGQLRGLRRASAAFGRAGSEEPLRPVPRRGGSAGPKTGEPASMAGVRSIGSGGSGGAGTGRRGSEEPRRRARNNRGPSPKAGDGVRGGDSDAVMLRSAEADPHITEHTLRAGAEAPVVVA
jgi:hypothetical protein